MTRKLSIVSSLLASDHVDEGCLHRAFRQRRCPRYIKHAIFRCGTSGRYYYYRFPDPRGISQVELEALNVIGSRAFICVDGDKNLHFMRIGARHPSREAKFNRQSCRGR